MSNLPPEDPWGSSPPTGPTGPTDHPPPTDPSGYPPPSGPAAYPPPSGPGAYPPHTSPAAFPPPGGYPQPGSSPYGYAQPGYQVPVEHPQGTTILVLGILSFAVCGLLAPVAWVMGNSAIREIDANPTAYSNRTNVQVGRILGMVYTILVILAFVALGLLLVLTASAGTASNGY